MAAWRGAKCETTSWSDDQPTDHYFFGRLREADSDGNAVSDAIRHYREVLRAEPQHQPTLERLRRLLQQKP